jgi:MoaA/NifB/PqqE/SkfB family radical SAM enzyme
MKEAPPVFVWWDVTLECGLKCTLCSSSSGKKCSNELTTDEAREFILGLAKLGVRYISLLGGEPLRRKDIVELISYAHDNGMGILLNSNGWDMTLEFAKLLKNAGLVHARISINGIATTHDNLCGVVGSFERAVNAVHYLRDAGVSTGIASLVTAMNITDIPHVIDLGIQLGVTEMQLLWLAARGRANRADVASVNQLTQLRPIFQKYREELTTTGQMYLSATGPIGQAIGEKQCLSNRACSVKQDGTVSPCLLFGEPIGSVRDASFAEIWQSAATYQCCAQNCLCTHLSLDMEQKLFGL